MNTMLLYVLFSHAASDFPIHTLRLLHSLALASQVTLCTPFASVFSGFSTNTDFNVSLSFHAVRDTCPETPVARVRGPFPRNYPLKKDRRHIDVPDDAAALATLFTIRQIS